MYVLKLYGDGSKALDKMTRREFRDAEIVAWAPTRPRVRELSRSEARKAYRTMTLDVIHSDISAEFEPQEFAQ